VLDVRDREVTALRFYVGGRWRANDDVTDLGTVPARAAADYLTRLAERGMGRPAREAIFPATLVDSVTVWPALLRIARDETRPRDTRQQAVFWLGQAAGEAATAQLSDLVGDGDVDREVRKQAVFALSQRPRDEGVPALIRVARTHRDREIRKQALFWLGQSGDPRAVALFEEILAGR
jgi:HEAT repeat protein